jgi:type I restriction enzyme R subunit
VNEGRSVPITSAATPIPDVAERLRQLVIGWRGAERGESIGDLHRACRDAGGPNSRAILPEQVLTVEDLDALTLRAALDAQHGAGRNGMVRFRGQVVGRFDAALVLVGPAGEACARWWLAIDEDLGIRDQVALYGHALGHGLHNRNLARMGRKPTLDPRDGYTHTDTLAELRQWESTRNAFDRRVLEEFPDLARFLESPDQPTLPTTFVSPDFLDRLAASGWRGPLVTAPYVFTDGRVYVFEGGARRGRKLRADALLRAEASLPIALVQARRSGEAADDAERRLAEYAHARMRLPFAYLLDDTGAALELDWTGGAEPVRATVPALPTRDALLGRYLGALGLDDEPSRRALMAPYQMGGNRPRFYQKVAVNQAVIALLRARKGLRSPRILLTLATGTGKTQIAFQIVWKLRRSKTVSNVLFLTDRDFLLSQAMDKDFAPLNHTRGRILGRATASRNVLFATYQAVSGQQGGPALYRVYPSDYFDLVIVDECHRGSASDESNWRAILEYFDPAVQLGLTATPLRTDNVKTYEYFGNPVAVYSLRQGITDGFLAPYRVRRVLMEEVDEAEEPALPEDAPPDQAAEPRDPDEEEVRRVETARTMVDRTKEIARHLAGALRACGDPMAKTIVFCVDIDHAGKMRDELEVAFKDLVERHPDYIMRIVSDGSGDTKKTLDRFGTPAERFPVVVTTSKLLSTGVDIPTCKYIVLARPVGSIVEFKQIIGRGTRLYEPEKVNFTILDYSGATRHFFDPEFDGDPELVEVEPLVPRPSIAQPEPQSTGVPPVVSSEGRMATTAGSVTEPTPTAPATAAAQPNQTPSEPGPSQTTGPASTADHPAAQDQSSTAVDTAIDTPVPVVTGAGEPSSARSGTADSSSSAEPTAPETSATDGGATTPSTSATTRTRPRDGRKVRFVGEVVYELGPDGRTLRTLTYPDYTREALDGACADAVDLRRRWLRSELKAELLGRLEDSGIDLHELAAALGQTDVDPLDLVAHVLFGVMPPTRRDRAEHARQLGAEFFGRFPAEARETLETILEKYVAGEAPDVTDTQLLKVPPLSHRGTFLELARPFGGGNGLRAALAELRDLIYRV